MQGCWHQFPEMRINLHNARSTLETTRLHAFAVGGKKEKEREDGGIGMGTGPRDGHEGGGGGGGGEAREPEVFSPVVFPVQPAPEGIVAFVFTDVQGSTRVYLLIFLFF
jgi:hypothetical protein